MYSLNEISYKVRGAIFKVHTILGPGLLESIYVAALADELEGNGLFINRQMGVEAYYNNNLLGLGFRIDIMVENQVIVEVKSVDVLHDVHKKQLLTYLKMADKKLGILVNFNVVRLVDKVSLIRIIN